MSEAPPTVEGGPPPLVTHSPDALPAGARLAEFEIRSVLGAGGFGIVYLAWDHALEREVALKEYMPITLAGRASDQRVTIRATVQQETFALGLRSFVNEARLLARFDHPSLVKVYRFWEANGTAYMAMPMYHGRTLRQVRQHMAPGSPGEAWCRSLMEPLLGALECLHREGVFHRDIAPDNIVLAEPGKPVLLDFGAARRVIGDRTHALTAILKPSFAPIEQYADVSSMRQGPWTDLYGVAATCYYLLTGQPPLAAAARALHDELPSLAQLKPDGCTLPFLQALDWAMAVRPQERPQSVAEWREVLDGHRGVPGHGALLGTGPASGLSPRGASADFSPTQPVPAPPGSTPAAGPVWRGFTVPGGISTVQAAPRHAQAGHAGAAAHGAGVAPPPARPMRRLAMVGAAVAMLAVVAAFVWKPRVLAVPGTSSAATSAPASAALSGRGAPAAAVSSGGARVAAAAPAEPASAGAPPTLQAAGATTLPSSVVLPQGGAASAVQDAALPASRAPADPPARERTRPRERRVAHAAVPGPSERCADRMFLTRLMCMKRACDTDPRLRNNAECISMQKAEQERRERIQQR